MTITTKKNSNFPITYGDEPTNNGYRLSDRIVKVFQNKAFQRYMFNLSAAFFALATASKSASAIPPEAGEAAANAADAALQLNGDHIPPIGKIQGVVPAQAGLQQPLPPVADLKPANLPGPVQNPIPGPRVDANPPVLAGKGLWLPAKPVTTAGQMTATVTFLASLTSLCLQAGFNPVAAFMCSAGIIGGALYVAKPAAIAGAKFILKITGTQ